ncbi:MAG: sulfotransferase family 2 domain-containing protein [Ectothiorhodospiraceae bacterium]|nr:sulfotransferase family 2 domain-containing protein [Ectothiorhodospiraceae bacterium]MCH8504964.1 sulfotransferase family 2 domain-containing protein [Ectothiorhodospiraceae bacterium]
MIICHRHRFIFIKTRKTAGSSAEIALSRACGPKDCVTRLSENRGEEELRRREGGYGPVNHLKGIREHRGFKEWKRLLLKGQRAEYNEHLTAPDIRSLVGDEIWNSYYKFTIERDPWDRALSRYYWQKQRWEEKPRKEEFPGISQYLQWLEKNKPHWLSNWGHYTIGDVVAVDRVLRYERLAEELEEVRERLGLDVSFKLPETRVKGGFRPQRRPYSEVLGDQDRQLIERLCRREIEHLGYSFGAAA